MEAGISRETPLTSPQFVHIGTRRRRQDGSHYDHCHEVNIDSYITDECLPAVEGSVDEAVTDESRFSPSYRAMENTMKIGDEAGSEIVSHSGSNVLDIGRTRPVASTETLRV